VPLGELGAAKITLNAPPPSVTADAATTSLNFIVTVAELLKSLPLSVIEVPGWPCVGLMLRVPAAKTGVASEKTRRHMAQAARTGAKAQTFRELIPRRGKKEGTRPYFAEPDIDEC
jgi:hypothetical protein